MRTVLEKGLPEIGVDTACIPILEQYLQMLLERNQVMNLTAITEPKEAAALHLLDSLALISLAGLERGKLVDVGTGAGLPGVPLAAVRPELQVTLLDSLGKRVDFLRDVCTALSLNNTACVHERAETFAAERRETYDIAVSRAVAALPVLSELCLPLLKEGGQFLAMKSSHSEEEIRQAENAIQVLGGRIAWIKDYEVPTAGVVHRVIGIEKVSKTPKRYPRRFSQIKKSPL